MIPPSLVFFKITSKEKSVIKLPIPVFLLWILLLPIVVLAIPLLVLWSLLRGFSKLKMVFYFWMFLCSLKGTVVEVNSKKENIFIKIC
ncbi:MAG: hypothetical protein HQK51_18805 [Oligoflexia bacterium]|nr:hypothetical protein [Oligoflexia bacterium]